MYAVKDNEKSDIRKLEKLISAPNLCDELEEDILNQIATRVTHDYEVDFASRDERQEKWDRAVELAKQTIEAKNTPYPNSANVKFPLMTTAAIQFNARSYSAIVNGRTVAKSQVYGKDPDGTKKMKATNVVDFMNWQLLEEDPGWEEDTDRLLIMLPIFGCLFRKRWFSFDKQRQTSKLLTPNDFVVNANIKSLEDAPRTTEIFTLYPNDIVERIRRGLYKDFEYSATDEATQDEYAGQEFLEQHRWEDLDEDGYKEPYIVTVHRETATVVRIAPRFTKDDIQINDKKQVAAITPQKYYVKYGFIPDPAGTYYDIGFCDLLYPINESVNTVLNQLLDAGKLANSNTGFISNRLRIGRGPLNVNIGKFTPVAATGDDIRRGIVQMQFPGPSPVLFQLLGLLIEAGREIANIKDVLTGESQSANTPATTTLALIEQGMKVFTGIHVRIHRALKSELKLLREIDYAFLQPTTYVKVLDIEVDKEDFNSDDHDFVPVSDPNVVTDMQKLGRAQFLQQFAGDPYFDPFKIRMRLLEAASIEGVEELLVEPEQGPTIEQQLALAEAENEKMRLQLESRKADREDRLADAKITKDRTGAIKDLADAEATEEGVQLDIYKAHMEAMNGDEGGVSSMAQPPSNAGIQELPEAAPIPEPAPMGGGGIQQGLDTGELFPEPGGEGTI